MSISQQRPTSPDLLLYTVYIPPIEPTPVPLTPPNREDRLLVALTWSDGVRKFDPPSMDSGPAADPHRDVDFYRPIGRSDNRAWGWLGRLGMWPNTFKDPLFRRKVGKGRCTILELPDGYTLYEKVHIPAQGKGRTRRTTHLFGHPSGEPFQTPPEFQPHYLWMACDPLKDPKNCKCKLCRNYKAKEKYPAPDRGPATHSTVSAVPQDPVGPRSSAPEPCSQGVTTGGPTEGDW